MGKLYVGIDVSKETSSAHGLDEHGKDCFHLTFEMNSSGFAELIKAIDDNRDGHSDVVAAMESTACYHINLYSFLISKGIEAVIVNPLLIANFARLALRKTKTDKKDAKTIACFLLAHQGSISQMVISQDLQDLRDIARERESLCQQISATKVEIQRILQTTFPELEGICNLFTKAMLHFIKRFPSARLIRASKPSMIAKTLRQTRGSCKITFTPEEIIEAARSSIATVSPAKEIILSGKVETLEHLEKRRDELTKALTRYCESMVIEELEIITSIDGISKGTATTFLAEVGPIGNYASHKNLIAYAGIDPTVYQSGKYQGA
ncbi:MAG: IS110 family transposase, partial [Nitrospira sp.]|nr:IS110 family transposase [Nitrospira sp.]